MSNKRVLELAAIISLPENRHVVDKFPEIKQGAEKYTDRIIAERGFCSIFTCKESYKLKYMLSVMCPLLVNPVKLPVVMPQQRANTNPNVWKAKKRKQVMYSSPEEFKDSSGQIVQEGVHYTAEEYYIFTEIIERLLDNDTEIEGEYSFRNDGKLIIVSGDNPELFDDLQFKVEEKEGCYSTDLSKEKLEKILSVFGFVRNVKK